MRWSDGCPARELPPLTVDAPGLWHIRGTGAVSVVDRPSRSSPSLLVAAASWLRPRSCDSEEADNSGLEGHL